MLDERGGGGRQRRVESSHTAASNVHQFSRGGTRSGAAVWAAHEELRVATALGNATSNSGSGSRCSSENRREGGSACWTAFVLDELRALCQVEDIVQDVQTSTGLFSKPGTEYMYMYVCVLSHLQSGIH